METIKYWWKHIIWVIWHPLDIADKMAFFVGAIATYLKQGEGTLIQELAWQIPLGAIIVFIIWRLMQLPMRILNDIRREREGKMPLTLEGLEQRISEAENSIGLLRARIDPQPSFDAKDITKKTFITYSGFSPDFGNIVRSVVFTFDVKNASSVWIQPTGCVQGDLIFEASRLTGINWKVQWQKEIEPDGTTRLGVIFPLNERLAESLAFKPIDGSFSAEFSEMKVEFEARDENYQRQSLGYIPLGDRYDIRIRAEIALPKIRKVVNWRDSLDDDERIR